MLTHRSVALAGSQGRSAPIELHNADAERSTLAAMILGPEGVEGARAVVGPADFYLVAHQRVFAAIVRMHDRGDRPDLVTLCEELRRHAELELVGGPAAMSMLLEWAACTANVLLHARIVRGYAQRRRLRDIGRAISQRAEDPTLEVAAIVAGARKALADVEPGTAPRCAVEGGA